MCSLKSSEPSGVTLDEGSSPADSIIPALERIDPFLRFLTKATGKTTVPLTMLQSALPKCSLESVTFVANGSGKVAKDHTQNEILLELTYRGVLYYDSENQTLGFPSPSASTITSPKYAIHSLPTPPSKLIGKGLHGSSEAAAKRRMKALLWTLEKESGWICRTDSTCDKRAYDNQMNRKITSPKKKKAKQTLSQFTQENIGSRDAAQTSSNHHDCKTTKTGALTKHHIQSKDNNSDENTDRYEAYRALHNLFSKKSELIPTNDDSAFKESSDEKEEITHWLPCQVAFAGSHPGREARYSALSKNTFDKIPEKILELFNLDISVIGEESSEVKSLNYPQAPNDKRKLFRHQAKAIDAAMKGIHTVICTSTGSGKSLCFLLPVISKALVSLQQKTGNRNANLGSASILIYPTKALAQDQLTKIRLILKSLSSDTTTNLRAGVIDGDTPHTQRDDIASECQIILTNPDTLHAAILPNWKRHSYKQLLERINTVVIDEAHVYQGSFGAHVALVLARLRRVCRVASSARSHGLNESLPLFIACSATLVHPEEHFRALCPITENEPVCVLSCDQDGSPCSSKHFFVWNPPLLDVNGNSTDSVFVSKRKKALVNDKSTNTYFASNIDNIVHRWENSPQLITDRETVENFERPKNSDEPFSFPEEISYSQKFIHRRHAADETALILAKAITSGIRCIAFCKTRCLVEWVYERAISHLRLSNHTSNLVSRIESYRGGYSADARRSIEDRFFRGDLWGVVATNAFELGVDVGDIDLTLHCGYPGSRSSLLQQAGRSGRGTGLPSCSITVCFSSPSEQYLWKVPQNILENGVDVKPSLPIYGNILQGHLLCAGVEFPLTGALPITCLLNEVEEGPYCPTDKSIFGSEEYDGNVSYLVEKSLMTNKVVPTIVEKVLCRETHPVMKNAWKRVNLRSIEPLNYVIVDINHPLQGGRTDKLVDKAAVIDSIPYSRVFYHAFPGAIITHRGIRYRIESMESPPPFLGGGSFERSRCADLCSFAMRVNVNYSTQALSTSEITVVKQVDSMEKNVGDDHKSLKGCTLAGRGVVNVKRSVHGYKKLSLVHRQEMSRSSIVLPSMEFDTSALWIDADALHIKDGVQNFDAGVHALNHAMVACAPIFTPCTSADVDCDHSRYECTRILLYDTRAGGSGTTYQLYHQLIDLLEAALELLRDCTSCTLGSQKYDGGCPGCINSVPCDNFQEDLSRIAAIYIGEHLLRRLKQSTSASYAGAGDTQQSDATKQKELLIGRPSWLDNREQFSFAEVDEEPMDFH